MNKIENLLHDAAEKIADAAREACDTRDIHLVALLVRESESLHRRAVNIAERLPQATKPRKVV